MLDGVLRVRADAPFACRGGVCGTCRARLIAGEVAMTENYALESEELGAGYVLTCQARPLTDSVDRGLRRLMTRQDPEQVARPTVAAMYAADEASRALGISYDPADIGPGRAAVTLTVSGSMVNGHGACHGGVLFTLADTAFGFACNSHGPQAVAHICEIVYARPVLLGDVLVASASERMLYGRSGVYDVTVTRSSAEGAREVVAEFRGHSRVVGKRN